MLINGSKIAAELRAEYKEIISTFKERAPCLALVMVGKDPASEIYVKYKTQACEEVGIRSIRKIFPETISEQLLLEEVERLNADDAVDGILVQLPLPPHINPSLVMRMIAPEKDVDGFNPINIGKLFMGETDGFVPCTPLGITVLFERSNIDVRGKHAVIVGRSNIVGRPMSILLSSNVQRGNCTVTICHSHTPNLEEICLQADIIVAALGKPEFVKANMVKDGAVVIDVGITRVDDPTAKKGFRIKGDVAFEVVAPKTSAITPVPGGVGLMTIAGLLKNTLQAWKR